MSRQFVSFRLGPTLFGVDVLLVREIDRDVTITPVSPAPAFVLGLMNLRGQIVPVVDLGVLLELASRPVTPKTRCVVLKMDAELAPLREMGITAERAPADVTGFLVDEVADLVPAAEGDIEPAPINITGPAARYVSGVVRLESGLMAVLRVTDMIQPARTGAGDSGRQAATAVSGPKEKGP